MDLPGGQGRFVLEEYEEAATERGSVVGRLAQRAAYVVRLDIRNEAGRATGGREACALSRCEAPLQETRCVAMRRLALSPRMRMTRFFPEHFSGGPPAGGSPA